MEPRLLGQVCALLAALTWAFALVLFKKSGEQVAPLPLNLFKNTVGLVLLALTLCVIPTAWEQIASASPADLAVLAISGFLGIALADTLFFYGLNRTGVGIVAIVDCVYSPLVIFFSWILLSEKVGRWDYIGGGFILLGVLLASRISPARGPSDRQVTLGIVLVVLAIALMAFGIVMAKPVLERFELVPATMVRLLAGTLGLAMFILISTHHRRQVSIVFRPSALWKTVLPAAILSTYLSLLFWVAGFKYTDATIAAVLNQTSTLFATALATIVLKEPFSIRQGAAAAMALSGVLLVTLGPE